MGMGMMSYPMMGAPGHMGMTKQTMDMHRAQNKFISEEFAKE